LKKDVPGLWPVAEGGVSVPGELYDVPLVAEAGGEIGLSETRLAR
jgi:hypothetical protein